MLGLTKGRQEYKCNECKNVIEKGKEALGLGSTYNGYSRGRVCKDCIIELGRYLEEEKRYGR
jgi:hypothetical protein